MLMRAAPSSTVVITFPIADPQDGSGALAPTIERGNTVS